MFTKRNLSLKLPVLYMFKRGIPLCKLFFSCYQRVQLVFTTKRSGRSWQSSGRVDQIDGTCRKSKTIIYKNTVQMELRYKHSLCKGRFTWYSFVVTACVKQTSHTLKLSPFNIACVYDMSLACFKILLSYMYMYVCRKVVVATCTCVI